MVSKQNTEPPAQPNRSTGRINSRMISKILSPAIRLWLRSQVEAAEALQFRIEGGDRQILSGYIPKVTVTAENVVYQGIALSHIRAVGEEIRINLRQVLQGVPLQLMDAVPIWAEAALCQTDINKSLETPLFANTVNDLLLTWLQSAVIDLPDSLQNRLQTPALQLRTLQVQLDNQQLLFKTELLSAESSPMSILIRTGLQVETGSQLSLRQPEWMLDDDLPHPWLPLAHLQGIAINLGSDVSLQQLNLEVGQIVCRGQIRVLP